MAQQTINVGTAPNDGTGTPLRTAFQYTNSNFSELYTAVGPSGNNIVCPGTVTVSAGTLALPSLTTAGDTNTGIYFPAADTIGFAEGGVEAMRINSAGNLVVNNAATITGDLTVNSNVNVGASPAFYGGKIATNGSIAIAQGNYLKLWNSTGNGVAGINAGAADTLTFSLTNTFTTAMTLNATGLGVGTSPVSKLTISDAAAYPIRVVATAGTTAGIEFQDPTTGATRPNIASRGAALTIETGGSERLRIDSSGNVGIGVTPSAWGSFFKSIESGAPSAYVIAASNVNGVQLASNCYNDNTNWLYKTTGTAARFAVNTSQFQWFTAPSGTAGNAITFTQAMTLDASGNLLVGVTSANASGGVLQLKSGITFPATQVASSDANTLDDYEEGTWTATLRGTVSDPTTPLTGTCKYTKIGRQVFVEGVIDGNTTGASGLVFISGLPFSAGPGSFERPGSVQMSNIATFTGYATAYIAGSAATINFYSSSSGTSLGNVIHNPGVSRTIWFAVTYTVS